jgi:RNA polymerase sigma-70 factor (ECF subfamily)
MSDAHVLFTEHRQRVFRYLCRIVGQTETAQDLTQEVFLRVSRAQVPDADPAGRRAWVFRIARNLALNHVRDGRRRIELMPPADAAEPATQELSVAIAQALDGLQPLDRDVFLMREAAGLSYDEIAAACDLTVEAVRARLHRSRLQLRSALDGAVRLHRCTPVRLTAGERER